MKMSNSSVEKRQNFLRQFRDESTRQLKTITAYEFFEILTHYDTDGTVFAFCFHLLASYLLRIKNQTTQRKRFH